MPEPGAEVADRLEPVLRRGSVIARRRPFVFGLCGAQGSGKSTVARLLERRLRREGAAVATLSLDDLYLPREAREALAARVHPLLRTRGPPGTHDAALGETVIAACGGAGEVALPRFSKARDTRLPPGDWEHVAAPLDVLIFEGWCVGARPQPPAALEAPVNALEREADADGVWRRYVNARLAGDYGKLFARVDTLALLAAPGFDVVAGWRREQEHALRARLPAGEDASGLMTDEDVGRFVQHYQRLTEHILTDMPSFADVVVRLDRGRRPLRAWSQPRSRGRDRF